MESLFTCWRFQKSFVLISQGNRVPEIVVFSPKRFEDNRGWFSETYNMLREQDYGLTDAFVQDNASMSSEVGTVRGIHFQLPPRAQGKLVRCAKGRLIDYVVDLRAQSPTYGQYVEAELSADNGRQIFVPIGFGHAFVTLEPFTEINYKVTDFYSPQCDGGISWDCPRIGIEWPFPHAEMIFSDKDARLPALDEFQSPFVYDGVPLKLINHEH